QPERPAPPVDASPPAPAQDAPPPTADAPAPGYAPPPPSAEGPRGQSVTEVLLAGTRDMAMALPKKMLEIDFDLSDTREEMRKKIAWIIRVRFVVNPSVFVLMFLTNWQGITRGSSPLSRETLLSTGLVAVISILLNGLYFLELRRQRWDLRKFIWLQLALDVLVFSAYVWRTGGVTSPFSFLYFLPIIGGSILVGPAAGMTMAALAGVVYSAIAVLVVTGVLPHVSYFVALDNFAHRGSYIILMMLVNFFAFAAVASASGFLIRQVHKKARQLRESNLLLERQAGLFRMLYQVSEVLQHHRNLEEVVDRICEVLVTGLELDRALMYVAEGGELKLRRVAYHSRVPESARTPMRVNIPLRREEGLTARCALDDQAFNVTDPLSFEGINRELAKKIGLNPFALAPMTYRDKVLGVLGIDRSEKLGTITEREFEMLILFARQAGQTLASARASVYSSRTGSMPKSRE
ncbi:MAG TPA: GAF domain-containing protein, partial [Myxococcota bacterium]|nr:GAF domain-containing protein [Myxococcota bacterium]